MTFPPAVPEIPVANIDLREFTAADLDGNRIRVFYDFRWELES